MTSGITEAQGITATPGAFSTSIFGNSIARNLYNGAIPTILVPSCFSANNGVMVVGQAPSSSATVSFSATSGAGVTMTFSAATLLGTAADVGRILTVLDTTYKYAAITAQSSTTVATVTLTGTLSGTGPFANNTIWLSGTPVTNTTTFSVPLVGAYANAFVMLPIGSIAAGVPAAATVLYAQLASTTVFTVFNNTLVGAPNTSQIPVAPAAFATTGVGAWTQTTNTELNAITMPIGANQLGPNGYIVWRSVMQNNNSAGSKNMQFAMGGSLGNVTNTTNTMVPVERKIYNIGVTNQQTYMGGAGFAAGAAGANPLVDTTAAFNLVNQLDLVTAASDWAQINSVTVDIYPG